MVNLNEWDFSVVSGFELDKNMNIVKRGTNIDNPTYRALKKAEEKIKNKSLKQTQTQGKTR